MVRPGVEEAILSIRKYLDSSAEQQAEAWKRFSVAVIATLRHHAVPGDPADLAQFQKDLLALEAQLNTGVPLDQIPVATGATCRLLQDYAVRTGRFVRAQAAELQSMLGMLTATITDLSRASQTTVGRLQSIEHEIEQTGGLDDIRVIRARLSDCLESLRKESATQREEAERQISLLKAEVTRTHERIDLARTLAVDPVTGLPSRIAGEEALTEMISQATAGYAVVFYLQRIRLFNVRFGPLVGEKMMVLYARMVAQQFGAADQLFRWTGPSFLALLPRQEPLDAVRRDCQRISSARLEHEFDVGVRKVVLSVGASFAVFPLNSGPSPLALLRKIDSFVAAQQQREEP